MGRGRAKAKQTKVARDLKYRTWDTDLDQLKRELSGEQGGTVLRTATTTATETTPTTTTPVGKQHQPG